MNSKLKDLISSLSHFNSTFRSVGKLSLFTSCLFTISSSIGVSSTPTDLAKKTSLPENASFVLQNEHTFLKDSEGHLRQSTVDPQLQLKLDSFIAERGSPISAVVVSDVSTGKILAMSQGRAPQNWSGPEHTALHSKFPAASLFKTIVTAAAMEMTSTEVDQNFGLPGGCGSQDILPKADWINDEVGRRMNLKRAYGHSCNSFFAKLAINQLGLGTITKYAKLFGWEHTLPTDFEIEPSKMLPPNAATAGTHTVGRFAAGFGYVGISPIHANWIVLALANRGQSKPLFLFSDTDYTKFADTDSMSIVSPETASRILDVMKSTVEDGTATNIFHRGRYRSIAQETGGKTGTLKGRTPEGLTTLFFGVFPLSKPQIAVSSVVVLEDRYYFKASQLAAEAILQWREITDARQGIIHTAAKDEKQIYHKKVRKKIHKKSAYYRNKKSRLR